MLRLADIFLILGRPNGDQFLVDLFFSNHIDVRKEVKLESGLFTAHLKRMNEGVSYTFTDEAMFLRKSDQPLAEGPLYLSGVFFYADGKDGFAAYEGDLPEGLNFSFTREEILQRLGKSTHQRLRDDDTVVGDRWVREKYSLSVTYPKNSTRPVLVSLFIPY